MLTSRPNSKLDKLLYSQHKQYSKGRVDKIGNKIEFRLTFDQWITWWKETGHYTERGRGRGKYVMSRKNDLGHYELGNVECKLNEDNVREASLHRIRTEESKKKTSLSLQGRIPWNKGKSKQKLHLSTQAESKNANI